MTHSWLLATAYAAACALWWVLSRVLPLWREADGPRFEHPWREVGIVLIAVVAVVLTQAEEADGDEPILACQTKSRWQRLFGRDRGTREITL